MRIWRTSPFLALTAVVALAMGIGFTSTMFSIVHGATRPLPFADAHELVAIEKVIQRASVAYGGTWPFDYDAWDAARAFESLGAYESVEQNLAGDGVEPERLRGVRIAANTFAMLGVAASTGRTLLPDDTRAGAAPVVVLSHGLWT